MPLIIADCVAPGEFGAELASEVVVALEVVTLSERLRRYGFSPSEEVEIYRAVAAAAEILLAHRPPLDRASIVIERLRNSPSREQCEALANELQQLMPQLVAGPGRGRPDHGLRRACQVLADAWRSTGREYPKTDPAYQYKLKGPIEAHQFIRDVIEALMPGCESKLSFLNKI